MDTLQAAASALGLGFLAGIRLYGTVLALGLALRFKLLTLPEHFSQLEVLADGRVLAIAALAVMAEFFADKIPWVDSAWDAVHTFIRPIGAAALATASIWQADPASRIIFGLLAGGVAFAGHSTKAATRFAVNHSPEPFSNVALSLAGDMAIPIGIWFWAEYPEVLLAGVILFLVVFTWLAPRIWRFLRLEWTAFSSWIRSVGAGRSRREEDLPAGLSDNLRRVLNFLSEREIPLPEEYAAAVQRKAGWKPQAGWRCAAGPGVPRLRGSIGYMCAGAGQLVFVTRRWFRLRVRTLEVNEIREAVVERRFLVDQLVLDFGHHKQAFDIFKRTRGANTARAQRRLATIE